MTKQPTLGVAMLTWKAPKTVRATIETHDRLGLLDHVDQSNIYFQEFNPEEDTALAEQYGWTAVGGPENLGIHRGMEAAINSLDTDLVLYIENDFPAQCTAAELTHAIEAAKSDIMNDDVFYVSLKNRRDPGWGFPGAQKYVRHFTIKDPLDTKLHQVEIPPRYIPLFYGTIRAGRRQFLIGRAPYLEKDPAARHPKQFSRTSSGNWLTDSRYFNFSNQPFMARRDLINEHVLQRAHKFPAKNERPDFQTLEKAMNTKWWRDQRFKISISDIGGFTQLRLDDGV